MPEELWTEVRDIVQETGIMTISMEKKCKKAKWLSGEALQIAMKRREAKSKGERERYKHLNAEFQRIARRDKKPSSAINAKNQQSHCWAYTPRKLELKETHVPQCSSQHCL